MSLLLEALKKAEKAKEEAQRRAKESKAETELALGPDSAPKPPPDAGGVRTRDQLPDISKPLEILSDEIAPGNRTEPTLALEEERPARAPAAPASVPSGDAAPSSPRGRASPRESAPRASGDPKAGERAAARKVFEAKYREPNPRLPFYITLGVLGVFALGTVVYFWYQLRPPTALVNANPQRPPGETPVQIAQTAPLPNTPAPAAAIPGLPPAPATPAPGFPPVAVAGPSASPVPAAPPAPAVVPAPPAKPAAAVAARPAKPAAQPPETRAPAPRAPAATPALAATRPTPRIDPRVEAAYEAYQSGKLEIAREGYEAVLRDEPRNRDSLLGLAAIDTRQQRYERAEASYRKLLQADPRDPHAQAGMLALRNAQIDPVLAESRVKTLLAADPEATVLYFTLGNQYALQGRWAEAQQAYFKAFAAEPENPDFAYNLAVSLDQLRQPRLALEHYRRALALAQHRHASFDAEAARRRVEELSR